jgi:Tfp pilus assembly protein PilN
MVNILPENARRELKTAYYMRLAAFSLCALAAAVIAGGALLVPAYLLAKNEADAAGRVDAALAQSLSIKEKEGPGKTLAVFTEELNLLNRYDYRALMPQLFSSVLAELGDGITLSKISFTFSSDTEGKAALSGRSKTRSDLVAFVNALQKNPLFQGVSVPVSDLATETNLEFVLQFSFKAATP